MTDLLTVLPDFDVRPFAHLIPSLEKAHVLCADLLTLDAPNVAKRAQVPPAEVQRLTHAVIEGLHNDRSEASTDSHDVISLLDERLDAALNGGIRPGYLTELVGESAVGKTQFLLTLLLSVQLLPPDGLGKSALYISTEAPLQTTRLAQILRSHPTLGDLSSKDRPTLDRVQSTHIHDLEAQEHILRYQVPVAIRRHDVGLVVVDSIAANYRSEFSKGKARAGAEALARRNAQLAQLGSLLRDLAQSHNVAVVVANQVSDRFEPIESSSQMPPYSQSTQRSRPISPPDPAPVGSAQLSQHVPSASGTLSTAMSTEDPLSLDHQQRFFTGWGDDADQANLKTPSLGLTWTNQLSTRIALLKAPVGRNPKAPLEGEEIPSSWRRTFKIVFSAWCAPRAIDFDITASGLKAVGKSVMGEG